MDNNQNGSLAKPQIVQPLSPPVAEVPCASCKKMFPYQPPPSFIDNQKQFSQVIWVHEKAARCPYCFQTHIFVIGQINIGWALAPTKETQEERSQIIVPGQDLP